MSSRPSEDDVFYGRSLSGTDFHGLRVNTLKLENLIHRFFGDARLGIELKDRFGKPFRPREWFLVPLEMVEQAIAMLEDGSIVGHRHDGKLGRIVKGRWLLVVFQFEIPIWARSGHSLQ